MKFSYASQEDWRIVGPSDAALNARTRQAMKKTRTSWFNKKKQHSEKKKWRQRPE